MIFATMSWIARDPDTMLPRCIGWGEKGSFQLEPVSCYPPDNIASPNDYILMEGCRLVDESKI